MKSIYHIVCLIMLSHLAYGQTVVSGSVRDSQGNPLPGANVYIKGTNVGTFTDVMGKFQINIPATEQNASITISMIGFTSQELAIGAATNFDVVLADDVTALEEIVITGYSYQEKDKITGAVNTVKSEDLVKLPVPSIDQALQGRAPGVVVSQNTGAPGEGVSVRIRGVGSMFSKNGPLYVIDGVPTLDIMNFSLQDVESISILKDASAAAVYGSRATNGVVIITTKSGKSKTPTITFTTQTGFQTPSRLVKMANTAQYVEIYNEAAANDNAGKTNPIFLRPLITEDIASTLSDTDHVDAIMRDALMQTHTLSFSGQENNTGYFMSLNYFDQEGIIKGSEYQRLSGRINVNTTLNSWLKTGINLNIVRGTNDIVGSSGDGAGGNGGSVVRYAFFRTPALPIYDETGGFLDLPERPGMFGDGYNPSGLLAYNNNRRTTDQIFGKVFVDINLLKDLSFTSTFGFETNHQHQRRFDRNWGTGARINNPNRLTINKYRYQSLTSTNLLKYTLLTDDHKIDFLAGVEAIRNTGDNFIGSEMDFPDQSDNLVYLGNGQGQQTAFESVTANSLLSFFGKIDYDLLQRYNASVTLRRDGSSRFGAGNRWGTFYAGSLGWRIDRESFLEDSQLFDKLFLRVGYGVTGNQEIGDYTFTDFIVPGYDYVLGNTRAEGYAVSALGNSEVKWESSNQLNAGFDVTILEGRLNFSFDYFNKITNDLLVQQPLPSSAGEAAAPMRNNGKILNRGIEITTSYAGEIKDFRYDVGLNVATLYNEVLEVGVPIRGGYIGSDPMTYTEEGHPVGSFYMYEMEGIFQDAGDIFTHAYQGANIKPGDVKFKDQDQDGDIDSDDRAHLGSAIPKLTAGFNLNLGYKNWDMSLFVQGAYGQKIFSVLNRDIEGFYRPFNVTERFYENRWTGPGSTNEYPRASWDGSGNNARFSSRFLEDGSYTRLKNVQIGYNVPASALGKMRVKSLRVYLAATNLLTLTKYSGMDPEMTVSDNARGEADRASGMDWGTYPSARTYNIGVNLTF
ncbi:MAG TPA: TonB-dependent receptor [Chryseosolibacter sp.]|nr:TonB-dependent receptor [Chryseosolibacter sp.]